MRKGFRYKVPRCGSGVVTCGQPAAVTRSGFAGPLTRDNDARPTHVAASATPQELVAVRFTPVPEGEPGKHMDPITKETFTNTSWQLSGAATDPWVCCGSRYRPHSPSQAPPSPSSPAARCWHPCPPASPSSSRSSKRAAHNW